MAQATSGETKTYHNYIGGEWTPAADGHVSENRDPANG